MTSKDSVQARSERSLGKKPCKLYTSYLRRACVFIFLACDIFLYTIGKSHESFLMHLTNWIPIPQTSAVILVNRIAVDFSAKEENLSHSF